MLSGNFMKSVLQFSATISVDRTVEAHKGKRYARLLGKAVNAMADEFNRLPDAVERVSIGHGFNIGQAGESPQGQKKTHGSDSLQLNDSQQNEHRNLHPGSSETLVMVHFKRKLKAFEPWTLTFPLSYQNIAHWFPSSSIKASLRASVETIRKHLPVIEKMEAGEAKALEAGVRTAIVRAVKDKDSVEKPFLDAQVQLPGARSLAEEDKTRMETLEAKGESLRARMAIVREHLKLAEQAVLTAEAEVVALAPDTELGKDAVMAKVLALKVARDDVLKNGLLRKTLEAEIGRTGSTWTEANASYRRRILRVKTLESLIAQGPGLIAWHENKLRRVEESLNALLQALRGERTLDGQEMWELGNYGAAETGKLIVPDPGASTSVDWA